MSKNLTAWLEATIVAAVAMALSFIPLDINWFQISLGCVILVLFSLRRGVTLGLVAGLVWGLLHFVTGKVYFLSVPQVLIEYVFAFAVTGLAGIVTPLFKKSPTIPWIITATLIGVGAKYFLHYVAGVLFWAAYAPEGMSIYWYSLLVNGSSGVATAIVTIALLGFIIKLQPKLFLPKA